MKRYLVLSLFLCCVLGLSCKKKTTTTDVSSSAPNAPSGPITQTNPVGGSTIVPVTKYFNGSIGSSLDLKMMLVRTGDQLNGNYYYQKIGTKIELRGSIDKDGNVQLDEFDSSGKQTGMFRGTWKSDSLDGLATISGNWSKPGDSSEKKTAFSVEEEPIFLTGGVEIASKQIKESNKKLVYEIAVEYPQLSGGINPNIEKFNQLVRGSMTKKVAGFKKDMAPQPDEDEPRPKNSMGSDLTIGYTIVLAQDDLISVEFSVGSYYQGAAHPNSYSEVVNYDLKNGKPLKLADLFQPGSKYLQAMASYCIDDLKKQSKSQDGLLDDSSIESGAGPSIKNYKSWTISKKGIGVSFDAYQVGPYAAGPQFVTVPYSALKELINPDGPIAPLAK